MNAKLSSLHLLTTAILLTSASQANANTAYTFTDLGEGAAYGINDAGRVVGTGGGHAVLWNGIKRTDLGPGVAYDINNAGQVAGTTGDRATRWNGTIATDLGPGVARAINDAGQVAGANGVGHATVWNGTTATDLGTLSGRHSIALGINDAGLVVGIADHIAGPFEPTLWNGAKPVDLTPERAWGEAHAINEAGDVTGWTNDGPIHQPRVWNGTTLAQTELGTLSVFGEAQGDAINNAGQVAGWAATTSGAQHAVLWNGTTITDLNSSLDASRVNAGWVLTVAHGINEHGWIVGDAHNSKSGVDHAFLLAPIPEPETYALLLAGLGLVSFMARRRKSVLPSLRPTLEKVKLP